MVLILGEARHTQGKVAVRAGWLSINSVIIGIFYAHHTTSFIPSFTAADLLLR